MKKEFSVHKVPLDGLAKFMESASVNRWRLKSVTQAEWEPMAGGAWFRTTHVAVLLWRFR